MCKENSWGSILTKLFISTGRKSVCYGFSKPNRYLYHPISLGMEHDRNFPLGFQLLRRSKFNICRFWIILKNFGENSGYYNMLLTSRSIQLIFADIFTAFFRNCGKFQIITGGQWIFQTFPDKMPLKIEIERGRGRERQPIAISEPLDLGSFPSLPEVPAAMDDWDDDWDDDALPRGEQAALPRRTHICQIVGNIWPVFGCIATKVCK